MIKEENVTNVREEDKEFINAVTKLDLDKRVLLKGIVIGLQLQEKKIEKVV